MGYTHYWETNPQALNTEHMAAAISDMEKIVRAAPVPLAGGDGEGKPEGTPGTLIAFNGVGEASHETFAFPPDPEDKPWRKGEPLIFTFCKTAHKAYDVVVVACLAAAADRLGPMIAVTSDGDRSEWQEGVALGLDRGVRPPPGRGRRHARAARHACACACACARTNVAPACRRRRLVNHRDVRRHRAVPARSCVGSPQDALIRPRV